MKRERILDIVRNHRDFRNVDVIALQETSANAQSDDASAIARALGKSFTSYQHIYHHLKARPQANGLVWNTERVHFDAVRHHVLPNHTQVRIPRAERALLNRVKHQSRVNLVGYGTFQNHTLSVCTAHLDVIGYRFKRQQFRAILDDLRSRPDAELSILAGDFNTFRIGGKPTWAHLKHDAAELGLRAISDEIPWTQAIRALHLRQKLDEIFVASRCPIHSKVWTLDVQGSDHLPIFAEITIE